MNSENQPQNTPTPETPPEAPAVVPEAPQVQQPTGQPVVQQVLMERSLKGVGGWLAFFAVIFGLGGAGEIMSFFTALATGTGASKVLTLIFAPILAILLITTVVFIAMQKKLGKLLALVTIGVSAVYGVINSIISYIDAQSSLSKVQEQCSQMQSQYNSYYAPSEGLNNACNVASNTLPILIGTILVGLVLSALVALYFVQSRRVKETLVG